LKTLSLFKTAIDAPVGQKRHQPRLTKSEPTTVNAKKIKAVMMAKFSPE
jgi:hypothetical protein